jgi:hypothetical protein
MEKHDLLVVNNSSYDSKTFNAALKAFKDSDLTEYWEKGESEESLLETGFEYGFWSAVKVLTGYGDGH